MLLNSIPFIFFLFQVGVVEEKPLPSNQRDSIASEDSSACVLSPVPGSGLWESGVVDVELQRGNDGLGFSILDFAVSFFF